MFSRPSESPSGQSLAETTQREIMRVVSIIAAVALVALIALTLVPEASAYHAHLSLASLVVAGLLLMAILLDRRGKAEPRPRCRGGREAADHCRAQPIRPMPRSSVSSRRFRRRAADRFPDGRPDRLRRCAGRRRRSRRARRMQGRPAGALQHPSGPRRERGIGCDRSRLDTPPTNTGSSARSAARRRSREGSCIAAGRPNA